MSCVRALEKDKKMHKIEKTLIYRQKYIAYFF